MVKVWIRVKFKVNLGLMSEFIVKNHVRISVRIWFLGLEVVLLLRLELGIGLRFGLLFYLDLRLGLTFRLNLVFDLELGFVFWHVFTDSIGI